MVVSNSKIPVEKYIPKEESAGIKIEDTTVAGGNSSNSLKHRRSNEVLLRKLGIERDGSLIGSCRAARLRQDNSILHFQENFKVKSLLKTKESFKL